jgi:hypothetical protein
MKESCGNGHGVVNENRVFLFVMILKKRMVAIKSGVNKEEES